jgi:hypothetical protein
VREIRQAYCPLPFEGPIGEYGGMRYGYSLETSDAALPSPNMDTTLELA